jgi:hypothetical protein
VSAPIPIVQADIFTERPFAGNPAAAVLDAGGLDEAAMQRIASEMLVPGTAFVSASQAGGLAARTPPWREVGYPPHRALRHARPVESGRLAGDRPPTTRRRGLLRGRDGAACAAVARAAPRVPPFEATRGDPGRARPVLRRGGRLERPAVTSTRICSRPRDLARCGRSS